MVFVILLVRKRIGNLYAYNWIGVTEQNPIFSRFVKLPFQLRLLELHWNSLDFGINAFMIYTDCMH